MQSSLIAFLIFRLCVCISKEKLREEERGREMPPEKAENNQPTIVYTATTKKNNNV